MTDHTETRPAALSPRVKASAALGALIMTVFLGAEAAVILVALCFFFTSGWLQTVAYALAGVAEAWILYRCARRAYAMELELTAPRAANAIID